MWPAPNLFWLFFVLGWVNRYANEILRIGTARVPVNGVFALFPPPEDLDDEWMRKSGRGGISDLEHSDNGLNWTFAVWGVA